MYAEVYEDIDGRYWVALYEDRGPFPSQIDAEIDARAHGYLTFVIDGE